MHPHDPDAVVRPGDLDAGDVADGGRHDPRSEPGGERGVVHLDAGAGGAEAHEPGETSHPPLVRELDARRLATVDGAVGRQVGWGAVGEVHVRAYPRSPSLHTHRQLEIGNAQRMRPVS